MLHHVEINGDPYTIREVSTGYAVTAASSLTDRFHRSYHVQVVNGKLHNCSCGDCSHRKNWCKHLRKIEELRSVPVATPVPVKVSPMSLVNGVLRKEFTLVGEYQVQVVHFTRGERLKTEVMDREQARKLWGDLLRQGWDKF